MVRRTGWKAQPMSRSVRSRFIGELAIEDKKLRTQRVDGGPAIYFGAPVFQQHNV